MKDANQYYKTLKIKEHCSAKVHFNDLNIVALPGDKKEKKKGKTDLDVEKLIAVAVKLGYHERRDNNNKLLMHGVEENLRAGSMKNTNNFGVFVNNIGSNKYVGAYELKHEEE